MHLLGLGFHKTFRKRRDSSASVVRALTETVAWCLSRSQEPDGLRSLELDPADSLEIPPYGKYPLGIWIEKKRESYVRATRTIREVRSGLIHDRGLETADLESAQSQGRLLLYEPLETVDDGAATVSSEGFFDFGDAPPWDTWIVYSGGSIVCWVPNSLLLKAQAGIDANPVDCIHWCKWSKLSELQDV